MPKQQAIRPAHPQSPIAQFFGLLSAKLLSSTARSLRSENLSMAELAALYLLGHGSALRINELAEHLALSLPAASRVGQSLVDRGFVTRKEDSLDRRAKVLALTKRGTDVLNTMNAIVFEEASSLLLAGDTPVTARLGQAFASLIADGMADKP